MRDIGLARRQFFGGLFLVAGALALSHWVLLPQWSHYQQIQDALLHKDQNQPPIIQKLPLYPLGNQANPINWEKGFVHQLFGLSMSTGCTISNVAGGIENARRVNNIAPNVSYVPMQMVIYGTFLQIEDFIHGLAKNFPNLSMSSISLQNVDDANTNPNSSPVLVGIVHMEYYLRNK